MTAQLLDTLPVRQSSLLYGEGLGDIILSELDCTGEERTLLNCSRGRRISRVCDHSEDAGVRCGGIKHESVCSYSTIIYVCTLFLIQSSNFLIRTY